MRESERIWNPVVRKLALHGTLDADDRQAVASLALTVRHIPRTLMIECPGDPRGCCRLLLSGYAARLKRLDEGAPHMIAIHVVGDMVDLQQNLLNHVQIDLQALTMVTMGFVQTDDLKRLARMRPAIADALWHVCATDAAIHLEWTVNVTRRDPMSRIAHLLCELKWRCEAVGVKTGSPSAYPLTPTHLADMTNLTIAETLHHLRRLTMQGIVARHKGALIVRDWRALHRLADFDPSYLHDPTASEPLRPAGNTVRPMTRTIRGATT